MVPLDTPASWSEVIIYAHKVFIGRGMSLNFGPLREGLIRTFRGEGVEFDFRPLVGEGVFSNGDKRDVLDFTKYF